MAVKCRSERVPGATVLPHCRVGSWRVVAAGAVVFDDIPEDAVAVGVPARLVRFVEKVIHYEKR
jgi:acetyltransferase-like isoleucine patch superfamily enzyme